jgi:hypothetical protein
MPPRYSYWTILAGGLPTAFRAAEREDLLPTFKRIQEKHPDAEMKWFARGKLWASPEAARQDTEARRFQGARDRTWRPGGEHRDPRQPYKDAKKAKNADRRKQRFERKQGWRDGAPRDNPRGDPLAKQTARPRDSRKPFGRPPQRPWRDRPPREKPHGDPLAQRAFAPRGPRKPDRGPRKPDRRPFGRPKFARNQGTEEPREPPRPKGPDREPRPDSTPEPAPPPRPSEPAIPPPGPPERGRPHQASGRRPTGRPNWNRRRS